VQLFVTNWRDGMQLEQPARKSDFVKRAKDHPVGMSSTAPVCGGLRVRSDLRAGAWKCRDCSGKQTATGLYEVECDLCVR
jgi:hypothetical protein